MRVIIHADGLLSGFASELAIAAQLMTASNCFGGTSALLSSKYKTRAGGLVLAELDGIWGTNQVASISRRSTQQKHSLKGMTVALVIEVGSYGISYMSGANVVIGDAV